MASARPFPPSSQRSAEARQAGHVPQAPLLGFGCVLLAVLGSGFVVAPRVQQLCLQLLSTLELVSAGQSLRAYQLLSQTLHQLVANLLGALAVAVIGIVLGRLLTQGVAFASLTSPRAKFDKLAPSRSASLLWCLGLWLLLLLTLSEWTHLQPSTLLPLARSLALRVALLTLVCLAIDSAFARASWFASLWLTRAEHLDAQREAFGDPAIRRAREQARRAART